MSERGWDKETQERLEDRRERAEVCCATAIMVESADLCAALGRIKELEAGNLPSVQVLIRNLTRRAESAERDAQEQRERADRLEAALREARGFLPAKDSAYYLLSEELRRVIGEVDDALAAQPAGK